MANKRKRHRVEPTEDWGQLELLLEWPEQRAYELIRPIVVFGASAGERARQSGAVSERTLHRKAERFDEEGMESLFSTEGAKRRSVAPRIRRMVVELKGEHPALNPNEIANIVYVRTGRSIARKTVKKVVGEEPIPLKMVRRFEPYHEITEPTEARKAVIELHAEGWTVKAIAGYLKINKDTVYKIIYRWIEEGVEGLQDRPRGRPKGVRKVDLATIETVRRPQENPELGAFRIHAALKQMGKDLSPATCGRILARNRRIYGLDKPRGGGHPKKEMPFASGRRHQYWSVDLRYLDMADEHLIGGRAYAITILENHSRAVLASAVFASQDLFSYLWVLYLAVERYGSPEGLVTDSGSIFLANRAQEIYGALNIVKYEIEKGKPWQNYAETTFAIQGRMADYHFSRAQSFAELLEIHQRWVEDYNDQPHWAHQERADGRRSPREVLGWLSGVRYRPEDLQKAFFSTRFSRLLDACGYATFQRWRIYGEEGFAGREAALWLGEESLTIEHAGEALSRYEVECAPGSGRLVAVRRPTLFETSHRGGWPQPRLFRLETLGEGWLKVLKLEEYAPRKRRWSQVLQDSLFTYLEGVSG